MLTGGVIELIRVVSSVVMWSWKSRAACVQDVRTQGMNGGSVPKQPGPANPDALLSRYVVQDSRGSHDDDFQGCT